MYVCVVETVSGDGLNCEKCVGGIVAGTEDRGDVLGVGVSRARFLKLAGLWAGLSIFPGSLFPSGIGLTQAVGGPDILNDGRYPIAAWWPPPPVPNTNPNFEAETARRYAGLAGANFNAALGGNGVGNDRANNLALTACETNDVRLVLEDSKLRNAIEGTTTAQGAQAGGREEPDGVLQALTEQDSRQDARAQAAADRPAITRRIQELYARFGGHPALAGILLYDEPGRSLFPTLQFARKEVERIFGSDELPYVNAWPSYASPGNALQAPSYEDYLDSYLNEAQYPGSAIAPPLLSFDHYPLLTDERITTDYFYNHAVIRRFALRFGVPSWGFVQSVGFNGGGIGLAPRRAPDEAEILWQINVSLAYGVKGIQYFTYWTPSGGNGITFGNALITRAGQRTALYYYAQRANAYLRKVGAVLLPLNSGSVVHANEPNPPRGALPFRGNPYVRAASGSPVILGFFNNPAAPAERYLLVANRTPNKSAKARLTISSAVKSVEAFDPSAGETGAFARLTLGGSPPQYLYPVMSPGRARLYRLRTG